MNNQLNIIIPPNIYKIVRNQIKINPDFKLTNPSPFSNPNATYTLNIQTDPKRKTKDLEIEYGFFNKLGIKGPLTINCKDVNSIEVHLNMNPAEDNGYFNDLLESEKLTINCDGKVRLNVWKERYDDVPINLKDIEVNCNKIDLSLRNLKTLNSVKINNKANDNQDENTYSYNYYNNKNEIKITDCEKISKIDLSNLKFINSSFMFLRNIPNNCSITLNPELMIKCRFSSPYGANTLKHMFNSIDNRDMEENIVVKDILNVNSDSAYDVKFNDFKKAIIDYSNKRIVELFKLDLSPTELKAIKKENKKCQKTR